ncbi:MAG: GNAT family acetyltransferase, partial [Acidobacteria bacterium]|nr:GNAT family acetyltransferase [Acidobacteriota bacterium]
MQKDSSGRSFEIRKYEARDREKIRNLCCDTGFLGNPIDPVFEDRELFADYLTSYYTDREPESSFVLLTNGRISGYLLGSRHPGRQQRYDLIHNAALFLRGMLRYWRYTAASKKYVHWILTRARREVPEAPKGMPHFHINLLAEARSFASTRALIHAYLEYLRGCGETSVFGQMVVFDGRRGARMFERYG